MSSIITSITTGKHAPITSTSADPATQPPTSDANIEILDPPAAIKKKIKSAFLEEGNITINGLLLFARHVLFPISSLRNEVQPNNPGTKLTPFITDDAPLGTVFSVPRRDLETRHYQHIEDLERDYEKKEIHPGDFKAIMTTVITGLLGAIQEEYEFKQEWKDVEALAYPVPKKVVKAKKVSSLRAHRS